jgi:hypothetical protein
MERLLVRVALWLRRPPSRARLRLFAVVLAVAVFIWGIELAGLWPGWATADRHHLRAPGVRTFAE